MNVYDKLYDWQKRIVDKFQDKKSFGLWLDMGLGKTALSVAFAELHKSDNIIIISPNVKAIEDENVNGSFLYWCKQSDLLKDYKLLTKHSKLEEFTDESKIFIVNYESLFKRANRQVKIDLKDNIQRFISTCKGTTTLIIDESHKLKTWSSMQTQAALKIQTLLQLKSTTYTYLLTGTPFTSGYIDLWSQLKFLGCSMTKGYFTEEFCVRGNLPGLYGWQQPIVGYKNLTGLFRLVHQFALTIKSESVIDLPEQIFMKHIYGRQDIFELYTSEFMRGTKILDNVEKYNLTIDDALKYNVSKQINNPYFRNIDFPDMKWLASTNGLMWLRARQLSIGFQGNAGTNKWYDSTRLTLLKNFLEANPDNYILFYNFTPELTALYEMCEKLGYNIDVYCGEIKSLTFYEKFSKLSDEKKLVTKKNIILANFSSGSTGVNWQEYDKCIIFDIPVYKDWSQGIKRIHRLGQKSTCIYHIFMQNNWLDNGMFEAIQTGTEYNDKTFESDLKRVQAITGGTTDEK